MTAIRLPLIAAVGIFLAASARGDDRVFLTGDLKYQEGGEFPYVEKESLGAFIDRIGGIIRGEFETEKDGRQLVPPSCTIFVTRTKSGKRQKVGKFKFGRDDELAWNFILEPGDFVVVGDQLFMAPDNLPREDLKFPPAKFAKPKPHGEAKPASGD